MKYLISRSYYERRELNEEFDDMYSAQMKVRRFHEVFNAARADMPVIPHADIRALRIRLIREELGELADALDCYVEGMTGNVVAGIGDLEVNLVNAADAIGDLLYVTLGTAVAMGINISPIFDAIHDSNMAKLGGTVRADGKILKPEGWQPPNIRQLLIMQGWQP